MRQYIIRGKDTTMKNKLVSTFMIAVLLCAAVIGEFIMPAEVFAATKTATLVDTRVSFDGKEPVIVQSYRIDGYNYVRVAEIAKYVNMGVMPAYQEVGVLIKPTETYSGGEIEKLTDKSISVELTTGTVYYASMPHTAQCFNYNNRYYYRLADIMDASQTALDYKVTFAQREAGSSYYTEATTKTLTTFSLEWDNATSTVKVNRKITDLQQIFTDARNGAGIKYGTAAPETPVIAALPVTAQPELTSPPKVGSQPAKILINESKGAYKSDGTPNLDNFTAIYRDTSGCIGECTWYAVGRFREVTGVNPCETFGFFGSSDWVEAAQSGKYPQLVGISDINDIRDRCIAEWGSHAVFVEYVERDEKGNPTNVYYTEANQNHTGNPYRAGVYYPDYDGKVKVKTYSDFISHKSNGNPLLGYIVEK